MGKLDGKIALIIGSFDGISFTTAPQFFVEGAENIFITGRCQQMLDEAVKKFDSNKVTGIQGDVSNMTTLDRLFSVIQKDKDHLDILIVNAAAGSFIALTSITEKDFDDIFNVNVRGALFTVQKVIPILIDSGSIILCGSAIVVKANPETSLYAASKAALRSFVRTWSVDLKERKIRVNIIHPEPE